MSPEFKAYQEQVMKNAKQLADTLMANGYTIVSGGTDTHLCLLDLRPKVRQSEHCCMCQWLVSMYTTPVLNGS